MISVFYLKGTMISLIDADIVCFRVAAASENDPEDIAILRVDKLMRDVLEATQSSEYLAFLTGSNNFRKQINPEYKAHRKDKPLPKYLGVCREFLVTEWKATVSDGCEADDLLGIHQTENSILCSIDKDLLQIPGKHYNFVKQEFQNVTYEEGIKFFWKQMLIGDVSDNLFGVAGIGKVKASKLLDHLTSEEEMQNVVCKLYNNPDRFQTNADCFWIWRNENEQWSDRK